MQSTKPLIHLETIPGELKIRFQWVTWRYETRVNRKGEEKLTKVPYNPRNGEKAETDNPSTWGAFEAALEACRRYQHDGVGYVFSKDDPFSGIDLDRAIEESGSLKAWAEDVVERLDSYTEITPSRRGLHIIVRAKLPPQGRRKGPIEMYESGRFFTMTGDHWPDAPHSTYARQEALDTLHAEIFGDEPDPEPRERRQPTTPANLDDAVLIEKAKTAVNGAHFQSLWEGNDAGYDSQSEADLALCSHLAFWTQGDMGRMDSLFRQSALCRPEKWDKKHRSDGATYGEMTIEKALSGGGNLYNPLHYANGQQVEIEERDGDEAGELSSEEPQEGICPPLPEAAQAVYQHLAPVGLWLEQYVAFAVEAAPATPRSFHEALGLFAASAVIARRLHVRMGLLNIFTNLYLMILAPSTWYRKSSGWDVLTNLLEEAELSHYLLPESMTPESMTQEMSLNIPPQVLATAEELRQQWLLERAFAAQRSMMVDEVSGWFDGFKRDYNTGLAAQFLKFYDCPRNPGTRQTKAEWRTIIRNVYLSFLGVSAPSSMSDHLSNKRLWTDGTWARFAIILPDRPPVFDFYPDAIMNVPAHLLRGINRLANLFSVPLALLSEEEDTDGSKHKVVKLLHEEPPQLIDLPQEVRAAWEAYAYACFQMTLEPDLIEEELRANYGRLPTQAIKVAMILAALDTEHPPVQLTLAHWAKAQQIVEDWRYSLHLLRHKSAASQGQRDLDKIVSFLNGKGADGAKTRDIARKTHLKVEELRRYMEELSRQGLVELFYVANSKGRKLEYWRRAGAAASAIPIELTTEGESQ